MNDILGRPVKVGDTIITNRPNTATFGLVTKVIKVGKSTITHEYTRRSWIHSKQTWIAKEGTITKKSYQFLVIDAQVAANHEQYPEAYV